MIEKNKLRISIILIFGILLVLIYLLIFFIKYTEINDSISEYEMSIEKINLRIEKERNKSNTLKNIEGSDIDELYFNKRSEVFEDYMQKIFKKYRLKLNVYQSIISEKDYSEISVNMTINSVDFFKLISDIENDKKFMTITSISVRKDKTPELNVIMKIGGFYK